MIAKAPKTIMSFHYENKKALHVMLFLLHSVGGTSDISRFFRLLYLADGRHLGRYGLSISGDSYLALKDGPAPRNIMELLRMIESNPAEVIKQRSRPPIEIIDLHKIAALTPYNSALLAPSEVKCMYETVSECKANDAETLASKTSGMAWQQAGANGEISYMDMAAEFGASLQMLSYIDMSHKTEKQF
jgi:hypothetical protein